MIRGPNPPPPHPALVLSMAKWSLVWPPWLRYWRICYVAIQVGLENGQSRTYYGQMVLNTAKWGLVWPQYGILVLCMGYLSYVWGICLMFWKKIKITCHPGATMAECIVLCMGYQSYVWDICLMYWILVLCLGYLSKAA